MAGDAQKTSDINTNIPGLQPVHFLGLKTDIKGAAAFVSDEEVAYTAGGVLLLHNHAQKKEKFIKLPERGYNINGMVVSPNKKVIAISEIGEPPTITIYDVTTLKRRRFITIPPEKTVQSKYFECMAFTLDSKMLLACLGDPDWTLLCFRWDKSKLESQTRANNYNLTGTIKQIACNPTDYGMIALVGDVVFRLLTVSESTWRQYGYSKSESINFTCAAWLSQDKLITGTTDGRLMVVDSGELKAVYNVQDLMYLDLGGKEESGHASVTSLVSSQELEQKKKEDLEVRALIAFKKGFIFSFGTGVLHLYEKETPTKYKKRNIFVIEKDELFEDLNPDMGPSNTVLNICINPVEDMIISTCHIPQLYSVSLWGPDITRLPEIIMSPHGILLHRGEIKDMAVCRWKPTMITAGKKDRTLRMWDYEKVELILYKLYQEDIYSVDLHPTGLYAIVGFASKLRFMSILIDDFNVTREIPIRYCNVCKFSYQGHLFAAVNGNVIMVYSTISFENVVNLKGHSGRITDLCWTVSDYSMVSCGTDGAVYEWSIADGKRSMEVIIKTCKFTGVSSTLDGKVIYAVGSDGEVKEITNGIVRTVQLIDQDGLDTVLLSNSNLMLFTSGRKGTIFSVSLPLKEKPDYLDFVFHNNSVQKMCFSYDDKCLLTTSSGGNMIVWKLINTMGKMIKLDKNFSISEDILIPYNDLAEKIYSIKDLSMRMSELLTEHSYQMRQAELHFNGKMKDLHEAYCIAIEELKEKNTQLLAEHAQEFHALNLEMSNMKRDHDIAMQNLESTYNEKLIFEYTRYLELEDKMLQIHKDNAAHIEQMVKDRKEGEELLTEKFIDKLHDKDIIIEELKEEIQQRLKEHEIIKQQIEDDADREIYELKTRHENELKEELETNIKIRSENGIYKKKVMTLQKEVDELKHTIFTLEGEHVKFKAVIVELEKNIAELKKEIVERDTTLQDKEKRIHNLKKKNQELEKYKFVLEYEIENLKSQIEPRERRIHNQKEQIDDMVNELENLQKVIESLELQLAELREKLSASHCEYKREQTKHRQANDLLKSMRIDLHHVSGLIQQPHQLKTAIKDMYHKYNADKDFAITQVEDCDVDNEFQKQRAYLEKSIKGLKDAQSKKKDDKGEERYKVMAESAELITETNILRQELRNVKNQNSKMASVLGISSKYMLPKEAQRKLADAVASKKTIHAMYLERLQNYEKMVMSLKEENKRLLMKLNPKKSKGVQSSPENGL